MNDVMLGFFDYHLKNKSIFDHNQYQKNMKVLKLMLLDFCILKIND